LPLGPRLTKQQAEQIYGQGKEAVVFALLKQAQMLAEKSNLPAAIASDPSTPSAQKPVFVKPNKNDKKRSKKPGCKRWYEEIIEDIQQAGVLHGDETGWRVNGRTHWLWCFTSKTATIFTIERSRGSPVVLEFIRECFTGVFVSDFWHAYNVLTGAKQKCLGHLLRDLKRVQQYKDTSSDWAKFSVSFRQACMT